MLSFLFTNFIRIFKVGWRWTTMSHWDISHRFWYRLSIFEEMCCLESFKAPFCSRWNAEKSLQTRLLLNFFSSYIKLKWYWKRQLLSNFYFINTSNRKILKILFFCPIFQIVKSMVGKSFYMSSCLKTRINIWILLCD